MLTKSHPNTVACPHCGDLARRVQSSWRDRIISWFTPVKRYRCDYCDWSKAFVTLDPAAKAAPSVTEQASKR